MVKYYVATKEEDFILDVPEDDNIQVIFDRNFGTSNELQIIQREKIELIGERYNDVKFNDHVLARYTDVEDVRCEHVKRVDPEVA